MELKERANQGLHAHVLEQALRLEPRPQAQVLDIGCGTGALLDRLRQRGYRQLTGLDIVAPAPIDGIRFVEIDLDRCATGLADRSIDLAMAVEVVEHIENFGSLLAELQRLLAPDGQFLVTTPNVHSLEARLRFLLLGRLKQFDEISDPTHVAPIVGLPFTRLLARHGFEVAESWGFPLDGSSPTSRPALRAMARVARWCGLRGRPAGDHLCLLIRRRPEAPSASKRDLVTAHY